MNYMCLSPRKHLARLRSDGRSAIKHLRRVTGYQQILRYID